MPCTPSPARRLARPLRALLAAVLVLAGCGGESTAPAPAPAESDPARARIVTADLANFWAALDSGGRADQFQRLYLDRASDGLRDFVQRRGLSAAQVAQAAGAAPRYLAALRPAHAALLAGTSAVPATIRANYARLRALYPAAVFPPLTLLVGRFSTGGTIGPSGLLVGAELYGAGPATPRDELTPFARANVHALDTLPYVVAHEHVHVQQARGVAFFGRAGQTLLEQSLLEGAADFLGELVSGGMINGAQHAWARPREAAVWADFQREMRGTDVSRWLYDQGTATADRPGDLGYFVGYRIVEAYWARTPDKAAAVRAILEMRDAEAFLAASGYAPGN